MTPKISILICSLPNRLQRFNVIQELTSQAEGKPVQILSLCDNKSMTVGEKRNALRNMAKAPYIAYVDDDDRVVASYIDTLLAGISTGADVICFRVRVTGYGKAKNCIYGQGLSHGEDSQFYYRKPNHLMVWRKSLCVDFKEVNNGEDTEWATVMAHKARYTEHQIDAVLYHYDFDPTNTETQK